MKLRHSARTDVGKTREHNEDNFGVGGSERADQLGELLVVCDGMGGHAAGEVASQIAVEMIVESYYGDAADDRPQALELAFEQANANIYARGQGSMGTTGVAALLIHDALHVANVGDSRAYLVRDGEIRQVSRDHSFVSDQVAAGLITADQARTSPHRNVITRALGYQPEVTVDLFRLPLQIGDVIVLSSDGMHGLVADAEILEIVSQQPPEQATTTLIELANSRGGTDNITVIIAKIETLDWVGVEAPPDDADVPDPLPASSLRERVTVELPTTERLAAAQPASAPPPPAPAVAISPAAAAPPAKAPAPRAPAAERRLNWRGLLLALLLLAVLLGILFFEAPAVLVPAPAAPPTAVLAATAPASTPVATAPPRATAAPSGTPAATATP